MYGRWSLMVWRGYWTPRILSVSSFINIFINLELKRYHHLTYEVKVSVYIILCLINIVAFSGDKHEIFLIQNTFPNAQPIMYVRLLVCVIYFKAYSLKNCNYGHAKPSYITFLNVKCASHSQNRYSFKIFLRHESPPFSIIPDSELTMFSLTQHCRMERIGLWYEFAQTMRSHRKCQRLYFSK